MLIFHLDYHQYFDPLFPITDNLKCCGDQTIFEIALEIQSAIQYKIQSFLYRQQPTLTINSANNEVCLPAVWIFNPLQCIRNFVGQIYLVFLTSKIN